MLSVSIILGNHNARRQIFWGMENRDFRVVFVLHCACFFFVNSFHALGCSGPRTRANDVWGYTNWCGVSCRNRLFLLLPLSWDLIFKPPGMPFIVSRSNPLLLLCLFPTAYRSEPIPLIDSQERQCGI